MTVTLAEANSIVHAAIAKARELNITVSVAVCDNLCYLIALNRMDGVYGEANRFAYGKALVSSSTGLPSGEVKGNVDHPAGAYLFARAGRTGSPRARRIADFPQRPTSGSVRRGRGVIRRSRRGVRSRRDGEHPAVKGAAFCALGDGFTTAA